MASYAAGIVRRPKRATSAFLLIHGFAAAPDEMGTLVTFLEENGIASYALPVAGHGTTPEDLAKTTRSDWYHSAEEGLTKVKSWNPKHLFVAGFSMGGLLSLALSAAEPGIDGLVTICPAVSVTSKAALILPILSRVMKYREVDLESISEKYDVKRTKYSREPLSAINEFFKLAKETRSILMNVNVPSLILQAGNDKTINPESGRIAYEGISSKFKRLHTIEGAEHVIPCHPTRKIAYPLIIEFVRRIEES